MATRSEITKHRGKSLMQRGEESPFFSLRRQMERVFDDFWKDSPALGFSKPTKQSSFSLRVDVKDTGDTLKIAAEVPGMDEKDIDVTLTKDTVTIKGEKKTEREEKTGDYYRMERSYGTFVRSIPLPAEIDSAKVQASLKKGVLTITLPKTAKTMKEAKKVTVKAE